MPPQLLSVVLIDFLSLVEAPTQSLKLEFEYSSSIKASSVDVKVIFPKEFENGLGKTPRLFYRLMDDPTPDAYVMQPAVDLHHGLIKGVPFWAEIMVEASVLSNEKVGLASGTVNTGNSGRWTGWKSSFSRVPVFCRVPFFQDPFIHETNFVPRLFHIHPFLPYAFKRWIQLKGSGCCRPIDSGSRSTSKRRQRPDTRIPTV